MAVTHCRLYFGCVDPALIRESDAPALTRGSVNKVSLVEVVVRRDSRVNCRTPRCDNVRPVGRRHGRDPIDEGVWR